MAASFILKFNSHDIESIQLYHLNKYEYIQILPIVPEAMCVAEGLFKLDGLVRLEGLVIKSGLCIVPPPGEALWSSVIRLHVNLIPTLDSNDNTTVNKH